MLISAEENIKRAAVDVKPALTPESVLTFVKKILASYLYSSKSIKFVSTQIRNKTYKHQTQIFKEIVDQLRHSLKKKKKAHHVRTYWWYRRLVSDRNLACAVLVRHETLSDRRVKVCLLLS